MSEWSSTVSLAVQTISSFIEILSEMINFIRLSVRLLFNLFMQIYHLFIQMYRDIISDIKHGFLDIKRKFRENCRYSKNRRKHRTNESLNNDSDCNVYCKRSARTRRRISDLYYSVINSGMSEEQQIKKAIEESMEYSAPTAPPYPIYPNKLYPNLSNHN